MVKINKYFSNRCQFTPIVTFKYFRIDRNSIGLIFWLFEILFSFDVDAITVATYRVPRLNDHFSARHKYRRVWEARQERVTIRISFLFSSFLSFVTHIFCPLHLSLREHFELCLPSGDITASRLGVKWNAASSRWSAMENLTNHDASYRASIIYLSKFLRFSETSRSF